MNGKRVCVEDRRPFFLLKDKKLGLVHRLREESSREGEIEVTA